jgi:transposase
MREPQFKLSRQQRDELEKRYKQERSRRVADRLHCLILLHDGKNAREVAALLFISQKTVKRWLKVFVNYGLEGLCRLQYENSGKTSDLSPAQQKELEQYLDEQIPGSAKEVMAYLQKQFKLSYSESGVVKLLKRLNYRYKKPLVLPAKADAEQQATFVAVYGEKKGVWVKMARFTL